MGEAHRSGCPINLTLEVVGDRWSLIVIRDMIFGGRRHFRELLTRSEEGIASNILASRLHRLVGQGIVTKAGDPTHKQRILYTLTEKGIDLLPVLAQMGAWGRKHLPASEELSIRAQIMEEGGPKLWKAFMAELREEHLGNGGGRKGSGKASVRDKLQAAHEAVVKQKAQRPGAEAGNREALR